MIPVTPPTLLGCDQEWAIGIALISALVVWYGFSHGDWAVFGAGIAFYSICMGLLRWAYLKNPWMMRGVLFQYLEFPAYIPARASTSSSERQRNRLRRNQAKQRLRRK
jgi:hypothetical protein